MNDPEPELFKTIASLEQQYRDKLPPVERWNPPLNGDLDMRIDREGHWYYQGGRIERLPMVKMFSSILKREGDDYFLLTPVEKWRIQVDVAPFLVTGWRWINDEVQQGLALATNVGHEFLLSEEHPLWVEHAVDGSPLPMVMARNNLPALIGRTVYYQLAEIAQADGERFYLESCGRRFYLN